MMEIRAFANPAWDGVDLYGRDREGIATGLTLEKREEGALMEPFARIDRRAAQTLIDSLWDAGLRPTQGKQSEGVTAAQLRHLEDMRAISFAKLNMEKPA